MRAAKTQFNQNVLCECGCGTEIPNINKMGKAAHFKHGHNSYLRIGEKNGAWKGGKFYQSQGYLKSKSDDHPRADKLGYVYEHILVYEKYHKCCILQWAHVHHKNGIKDDNVITNLDIFPSIESHLSHHALTRNRKLGRFTFETG